MKIQWGIRGKLIGSMMATLIPFLALSLYWSYRESEAERGKIRLETLRFASSGATIADEFITSTEQVLMTVAETPAVRARDRWLLTLLVKNLKLKFPFFLNLIVVDERGDLIASAIDLPPGRRVSYADRQWFQEISLTRRPVISELITGRITGLTHVVIADPIRDRNDRFRGAVAAPIDLQGLQNAFGRLMLPADATMVVLDRRGAVLLRLPPKMDWMGRRVTDHALFQESTRSDRGFVEGPSLDGTEQLNAFAATSRAPWSILVSVPLSRAQAGFMQKMSQAAALIAAALIIAFLLGTLLSRRIAEPIRRLTKGAKAIGEGRLDARIERVSSDEIGELTEDFNRMADSLQTTEAQRERRTTQLATLNTIASAMSRSLDLDQVLREALSKACEVFGADAGAVFLLGRDERLRLAHHQGLSGRLAARVKILKVGEGVPGQIAQSKQPAVVRADQQPMTSEFPLLGQEQIETIAGAPLIAEADILGVIVLASNSARHYSPDEIELLATVGKQVGVALQNARLHEQVMESKTYLEQVIESSHDGIITVNPDLTIRRWSRGAEQILGWNRDEVVGRQAPFVSEELWEEARAKVAQAMEGRQTVYYETIRFHKDGRPIDVSLTLSPLLGSDGQVLGAMAILRDITDRKRFEQALKGSEEKYRTLFESANDPIFLIDPENAAILDANRQAVATSGYSVDELRRMRIPDIHPTEEREKAQAIIKGVLEQGAIVSFGGTNLRTREGRLIPLSISARLAEFGGRRVIMGIARDITDLRRAEEERATIQRRLLQAEKLASLGQLAAGVAHEINNPLATIAGCAEGLLDRATDPLLRAQPAFQEFPDYLAVIEEEAYRCKEITGSLLQFVRAEAGDREPIDVNHLLEKSLEPTSYQPRFNTLALHFELAPDLPFLQINQNRLRQVFLALAVNALESCGGEGRLTVRTLRRATQAGNEVAIEFEDTGCGIPPELLGKIFEPFFTTKGEHRGTGLGLAICHSIVAEHGGQIEVESEVGRGSLFRIILPVSAEGA
ncbi:MAG: PAS domain S-box protein [Candidatus Methylomirabilis oxyfera]|nr:PAS domain S-box protein [Candidatus Methylomirabilis oxyfera]